MVAFIEYDQRQRQRHTNPETAREVDKLGVTAVLVLGGHAHGLE